MATTTENTDNVPSKIIKLESNDGKIFEIDQDILDQLSALKELTESILTN